MTKRILLCLLLFLFFQTCLHAKNIDVSVGVNVWYNWWNPPWGDGKLFLLPLIYNETSPFAAYGLARSIPAEIPDFETGPQPLYGPLFSIKVSDRVILSTSFVYGRYVSKSNSVTAKSLGALSLAIDEFIMLLYSDYRREIQKYDSDTTVNYKLHENVKLFFGFKYQGYRYDESTFYFVYNDNSSSYSINISRGASVLHNLGPGTGIGINIPLYKSLYLLYNISSSVLYGTSTYDFDWGALISIADGVKVYGGHYQREKFMSISGNTSLNLAYYIEEANLTLALGGGTIFSITFTRGNFAVFSISTRRWTTSTASACRWSTPLKQEIRVRAWKS